MPSRRRLLLCFALLFHYGFSFRNLIISWQDCCGFSKCGTWPHSSIQLTRPLGSSCSNLDAVLGSNISSLRPHNTRQFCWTNGTLSDTTNPPLLRNDTLAHSHNSAYLQSTTPHGVPCGTRLVHEAIRLANIRNGTLLRTLTPKVATGSGMSLGPSPSMNPWVLSHDEVGLVIRLVFRPQINKPFYSGAHSDFFHASGLRRPRLTGGALLKIMMIGKSII